MDYTILPIIRTKQLNDGYFEVVLKRKREMLYKPGDSLYIEKEPNGGYERVFVASGVQEPWIRIILASDDYEKISQASKLRVKHEKVATLQGLAIDIDKPVFIAEGLGVAPFLAYISSFPSERIILYTIGSVPNDEWLDNYPQAIKCASVKAFKKQYKEQALKNHYIVASEKTRQAIEKHLSSVNIEKVISVNF